MARHGQKRRAKRQAITRRITGASTVYSASAWWPDNDPSLQVIALKAADADRLITRAIKENEEREQEYLDEDGDSDMPSGGHMRWSGVHSFKLADLVSGRELADAIRDLKDNGHYYPEWL